VSFVLEREIYMNLKEKYLKLVDERQDELLKLVSDFIKIPSENPTGSMNGVVDFVKEYFSNCKIDFEEVTYNKKFPNIVVTMGSNEENKILLNGHADVVPVGDLNQWNFEPFSGEITDKKILGRGTSDMKAGLSGLMFAMKILKEAGANIEGMLQLHVVTDEESGGEYGTKALMENGYGKNAKACIIAEPTSNDNIEVGQKGSLNIKIMAKGVSAHGSIGNYVGENAIEKVTRILADIHKLREMKGSYKESQMKVLADSKEIARRALNSEGSENVIDHVSVNVGIIKGGVKDNMVPDYCEASINCRLPIGVSCMDVEKRTREIVDALNITGITLDFKWNCEANYTEDTDPLVKSLVENAEAVSDTKITPAYQWATSDARYYRYEKIPTIQVGPANLAGIHSYNEDVDIEDVINSTKVYVAVLIDLLNIKE